MNYLNIHMSNDMPVNHRYKVTAGDLLVFKNLINFKFCLEKKCIYYYSIYYYELL